jgi:anti-anti-sigma regulatory factor
MAEFATVGRDGGAPDRAAETGVVGPLTHATTPALHDCLRRVIESRTCPRLRLDLSCCTSIDLDGMLALSVAQHAARNRGIDLRLVHVPPLIARQLRQHNFDELLAGSAPDGR